MNICVIVRMLFHMHSASRGTEQDNRFTWLYMKEDSHNVFFMADKVFEKSQRGLTQLHILDSLEDYNSGKILKLSTFQQNVSSVLNKSQRKRYNRILVVQTRSHKHLLHEPV